MELKRIYHPYWLWEDYKAGFYNSCSGTEKKEKIESVLQMFNSEKLTTEFMNRVITEWKYSCEHNLTNESMNKIAYIGQGACCLFSNIPYQITMNAWNKLDLNIRIKADIIAKITIKQWERNHKLKIILENGKGNHTQMGYQMKFQLN